MANIYVGCSLTQAPVVFHKRAENLKAILREAGHEVANFVGLEAGTAVDVYETDIHKCVADCELMVALCDYPSIGLGWEMGTMVEKLRKPVLAVAHHDSKISRLLLGADCPRNLLYRFARYSTQEEIPDLVAMFLKEQRVGRR